MKTWHEVWDEETANWVGDFDSQEAALDFMRSIISQIGNDDASTFELLKETEDSHEELIARRLELVRLALGSASPGFESSAAKRTA